MHVGHLLPLMVLYWMYLHGFHACSLVGNILSDFPRNATNSCSLEVPLHKLAIPLGELRVEKYNIAHNERSTLSKFTCN